VLALGGNSSSSSNGATAAAGTADSSSPVGAGLFAGGLFKGAASISLSSTDGEHVAAADDGGGQLLIPKHWNEQIRTAPLGRRRVLQRWVRAAQC
jgi:hypothetical protein